MYKIIALIFTCLALTSCGLFSMSETECQSANWPDRGYADGAAGRSAKDLSGAIKDCSKYGIAVDQQGYRRGWKSGLRTYCTSERGYSTGSRGQQAINFCPQDKARAYLRGWEKGVRTYCTPKVGYAVGKSGQSMPNVCPGDLYARFKEEYDRGYRRYQRVQVLKNQQGSIEKRIAQIDRKIRHNDRAIRAAEKAGDNKTVAELLRDNRDLQRERRNLELQKTSLALVTAEVDAE